MISGAGTLVFDQPSVKDAAVYIHSLLAKSKEVPLHVAIRPQPAERPQASAGISLKLTARMPCRFDWPSKQAEAIQAVPYNRWDLAGPSRGGRSVIRPRFGGWLENVDQFDSRLFSISEPEAELMDPQQRLLLETAFEVTQVASLPLKALTSHSTITRIHQPALACTQNKPQIVK